MYKLYICAAIFILLSAFKCFAPKHGEQLRQQVQSIIDRDEDYSQKVEALGRRLSESGLKEEVIKVIGLARDIDLKETFSQQESDNTQ